MPIGRHTVDHMTLDMECWPDELSAAQMAAHHQAESEHQRIRSKLSAIVGTGENLFLGDIFSAYELTGAPAADLQEISKTAQAVRKEYQQHSARQQQNAVAAQRQKRFAMPPVHAVDDDDDAYNNDDDYAPPLATTGGAKRGAPTKVAKLAAEKKREASMAALRAGQTRGKQSGGGVHQVSSSGTGAVRPSENTSIGGLSVGDATRRKEVVDLTKDEPSTMAAAAKGAPDSREVTFNKLQGKTFPSLVVVARPSLRVKDAANDRPTLDAKVKSVLMHTATKFSEWLIQQGLVRSEQSCQMHPGKVLKLGMYSDASKFAFSGGYLWISECCPARYVSVFNGSLFEGAPHAPSVLLKLIYHWSCQTNVQNVVQWVKVDNLYVKGLYTLLRAVCTVALHQHGGLLGGAGKRVEVGVISLGTTSQDGQQRQVKVEVLGVLDHDGKVVRLRAVEPLSDGERNYKKRFAKILEPLADWVHKDSVIQTDLTVDKGTMHAMGFRIVHQTAPADAKSKSCNANIMDYLRRIVPRMFQNTLSLLSRQIIQQFLDELVWREWYGTTPGTAFDNIVRHIAEQTRLEAKEPLVGRLAKVSHNPFRNWAHLAVKTPPKALRDNFFAGASSSAVVANSPTLGKRARKHRELSPEPPPPSKYGKKTYVKEEPRMSAAQQRKAEAAAAAAAAAQKAAAEEKTVHLEAYYYGIMDSEAGPNDSGRPVDQFRAQCPDCHETCHSNVALMDHLKSHAADVPPADDAAEDADSVLTPATFQCRYCLQKLSSQQQLVRHMSSHPLKTRTDGITGFACLICEIRLPSTVQLTVHMQKVHVTFDLPYRCGCCGYGSSALRTTVDHFYTEHAATAALQCPFCMQIFCAADSTGQPLAVGMTEYVRHLRDHQRDQHAGDASATTTTTTTVHKCNRCALSFLSRGEARLHQSYAHSSQNKRVNQALCRSATRIAKPKYKYNYAPSNVQLVSRYEGVEMAVENGHICLECDSDFEAKSHFPGLMKCQRCPFQTSCQRAMISHTSGVCSLEPADDSASVADLPLEYHCICGFASANGNALARHLVSCGRRSAYGSVEAVQENTVQRNMLDMLDLVRNSEEGADDEMGEQSESLLEAPASDAPDGQSNDNDTEATAAETLDSVAQSNNDDDDDGGTEPAEPMDQDDATAAASAQAEQSAVVHQHQFNTDLSLDDLAAPASVAPPPPMAEPDRTPQLSDEYQSLATPRIAQPADEQGGTGASMEHM